MTKSSLINFVACVALGAGVLSAQSAEDLRMTVGKSVVIDYPADVRQISTSNPDVIDASPVTTRGDPASREVGRLGHDGGVEQRWPENFLQRERGSEHGAAAPHVA